MLIRVRDLKRTIAEEFTPPHSRHVTLARLEPRFVSLCSQIDDCMDGHVADGTLDESEVASWQTKMEAVLAEFHALVKVASMGNIDD